jgi:tripartite-type tricarboxylate transporter receptor subunit TctC
MARKALVSVLVTVFAMGILITNVQGENYPTRPIELSAPYSAGSATDIMIRLVADIIPKYLGQPLVIINKPGANGALAVADLITAKPDGYKLAMTANTHFGIAFQSQKLPFDINDIDPLLYFYEMKHGLSVKGDSPWKTLDDLLKYAKENPGKLRWGHVGRGGTQYLYGTLVFRKAGVETNDLPYKGSPEQISAVLGGHLDATISTYGPVKDLLKTGRLRYLTVYTDKRYSDLPDIPSCSELGFEEAGKIPTRFGISVHKNTPGEIKKTLVEAFRKTYESLEFKAGIEKIGEEPKFGGPEEMKDSIRSLEKYAVPILKELGLYVEQK